MTTYRDILKSIGWPTRAVVVDFECFFDTNYTLKKMSSIEYIEDPRFDFLSVGLKSMTEPMPGGFERYFEKPEIIDGTFKQFITSKWFGMFAHNVTWLIQNARFDAIIFKQKFGLVPPYILDLIDIDRQLSPRSPHDLESMAEEEDLIPKGETIQFKGLHWDDMTEIQREVLQDYNLRDCRAEAELFKRKIPLIEVPSVEIPLMRHTLKMCLEPHLGFDQTLASTLVRDMMAEARSHTRRTGLTEKQLRSNNFFVVELQKALPNGESVPMKPGTKGPIPALAKDDDGLKWLLGHKIERVRDLTEARVAVRSWPTHIKRVLRLSAQAKALGGRIWVPLKYYGGHCMPGEAEVLGLDGWHRLDQWNGGPIVQWTPDQKLCFDNATLNCYTVNEPGISVDAPYLTAVYTNGHTIPRYGSGNRAFMPCQAGELLNKGISYLPISGMLAHNGSITPEQMRVLVSVQADGHWQMETTYGRELRWGLTKQRKQERLRKILHDAQVTYRECIFPSHPGEITFRVRWIDCPSWLCPDRKIFGAWLLDSTPEARQAFVDEIVHWDGYDGAMPEYYSVIPNNHEWVVTLCHLCGFGAKTVGNGLTTTIRKTRSPGQTTVMKKHCSVTPLYGKVYCPTTKTGYWLVRYRGQIHVTGNTGRWSGDMKINAQNLGGKGRGKENHPLLGQVRKLFVASPGMSLCIADLGQIEARVLAWMAGQLDLLEGFAQGKDIYSEFATALFGHKVRESQESDPPEIAKRFDIERGFGKDAILGCGYGMGADKFFMRCRSNDSLRPLFDSGQYDFTLIERLIKTYRTKYSKVPELWKAVEKAFLFVTRYPNQTCSVPMVNGQLEFFHVDQETRIRLPSGRTLKYKWARVISLPEDTRPSLVYKDGPLWGGSIVENIDQAISRDILAYAILKTESQNIPVVLHCHDEIVVCVPENKADQTLILLNNIMTTNPIWAVGVPLKAKGKVSQVYTK